MNVQRAVRLAASIVALVTLSLVVGCGDDDGTGTNGSELFGTWSVTSILIDDVEVLAGTSFSFIMTLRSNGTYSFTFSGDTDHLVCEGTTSCSESGTYIYTSNTFTFCDPGCDAQDAADYTISGDTLTWLMVDVDEGVTIITTLTFVRI
jgi:hypothetical protein